MSAGSGAGPPSPLAWVRGAHSTWFPKSCAPSMGAALPLAWWRTCRCGRARACSSPDPGTERRQSLLLELVFLGVHVAQWRAGRHPDVEPTEIGLTIHTRNEQQRATVERQVWVKLVELRVHRRSQVHGCGPGIVYARARGRPNVEAGATGAPRNVDVALSAGGLEHVEEQQAPVRR